MARIGDWLPICQSQLRRVFIRAEGTRVSTSLHEQHSHVVNSKYIDIVQGPNNPGFLQLQSPPLSSEGKLLCDNQKIRNSAYTSFSFFGLAFTFITGTLIIAESYAVELMLACFHKRRKYKSYAYLEWISHSSLQLHWLAHEELRPNTWSDCDKEVPITAEPDHSLAGLSIEDPKHPTLQQPVKQEPMDPSQGSIQSDSVEQVTNNYQDTQVSDGGVEIVVAPPNLQPEHDSGVASDVGSSIVQRLCRKRYLTRKSEQQVCPPLPGNEMPHITATRTMRYLLKRRYQAASVQRP
ncbi:hypothetical protein F4679DRAFT_589290 [Xylaria curta]|nr:hypothetical protein F4679DRAFT_589290 [Xylaria curta]